MAQGVQPGEREPRGGADTAPSRSRPRPETAPAFVDGLEAALAGLCQATREILGTDYAALGILDRERLELGHFITVGLDGRARAHIGGHPRGRGVLGLLIADPRPLRIEDLPSDPRSYGFPTDHPRMRSFLGAPIVSGGEAWGNIYVAEKERRAFDDADERALIGMAKRAAAVIESARD